MTHSGIRLIALASLLALAACGASGRDTPQPTGSATTTPGATNAAAGAGTKRDGTGSAATGTGEPPTLPTAPPASVDLLHAVTADIAVSSVYRDRASEAAKLVDGDLESAWNSRTGELVGAWIEVRLPSDATVTGIALTPGFAKSDGTTDLFTGNHRISRVRVLREGAEVGVFAVETATPALVTVPVTGAGGVYRIEVVEVVAGSRPTWLETCVSELQVLGYAPAMTPGRRLPRTAVGALPAPRTATVADRALVAREHGRQLAWLENKWPELVRQIADLDMSTGEPDPDEDTVRELEGQRDAILTRIAALADPVDIALADPLRISAGRAFPWGQFTSRHTQLSADLVMIGAAIDAVTAWLGDDEARCRGGRTMGAVRLVWLAGQARARSNLDEVSDSEEMMGGGGDPGAGRRAASSERLATSLDELATQWNGNSRGTMTRVLRLTPPNDPETSGDWTAMRASLETARTACGWAN